MCDQEPGLFTSTIPAMVIPRKTSRETKRWGWFDIILSADFAGRLSHKKARKMHKRNRAASEICFCAFCASLWQLLLIWSVLEARDACPDQTTPARAASKLLRIFSELHPSRGSWPAKWKSSGRSGPGRYPASKV